MKKKILLALICLFSMTYCHKIDKRDSENSFPEYKIELSTTKEWSLENLIDSCFYIALETTDSNLLGRIYKINIDSIIGISDGISNSLHLYSMQGDFLNCIDKIGGGPGEYLQLSDFALSAAEKKVDILDAMQKKIISYSWNGDVIKEIKLPFEVGVSIFCLWDNAYAFDQQVRRNNSEWKYSLITLSEDGKVIKKMFPYDLYADIIFSARNTLMKVNDTLVYLPTYNDTLFSIVGDKAYPRYKLDFGDKWIQNEYVYDKTKSPMNFINGLQNTDFIYFLNVLENTSTIWIRYVYKGQSYNTLINKNNSSISTFTIKDENNNCGELWGIPLTTWYDFFVIPVKPDYIKKEFKKNTINDDNPCLLFVKLKK